MSSVESGAGSAEGAPALVAADAVSFNYGATQALTDCSFEVRPGEVHALLGENGCGKSTLVKLLGGVLRPKAGSIMSNGRPVLLRSPSAAWAEGIAPVYQETLIAPDLSVFDNIVLGEDAVVRTRGSVRDRANTARRMLDELGLTDVRLDSPVSVLPLSQRHLVTVARALVRPWRLLILDEATSALDVESRSRLLDAIRGMLDDQHGVLFISHRLDEVLSLSDRITVLRAGHSVGLLKTAEATREQLLGLMAPASIATAAAGSRTRAAAASKAPAEQVVLTAHSVVLRPGGEPFDLEVRTGEIVGLAGLEGHGQAEFLAGIGGRRPLTGGTIRVLTESGWSELGGAKQAMANGISYGPVDRKHEGIFPGLPIVDNLMITALGSNSRFGLINRRAQMREAQRLVSAMLVKTTGLTAPIESLSGGNQQKVLLGRWLASEPRILALNDPLRGVDAAAKADIMTVLARLVADGLSIVMVCTELLDLFDFCDRVVVFREQTVVASMPGSEASETAVIGAMIGAGEAPSEGDQK